MKSRVRHCLVVTWPDDENELVSKEDLARWRHGR